MTTAGAWHVVGAGSLGLLWAFHLRQAGYDVTLWMRNADAVARFRAGGSRIHVLELWRGPPIPAWVPSERMRAAAMPSSHPPLSPPNTAEAMSSTQISQLVVATKAQDTVAALQGIMPYLARGCRCILLQNGVLGVVDELRRELGAELCLAPATLPSSCRIGQPLGSPGTQRSGGTADARGTSGMRVHMYVASVTHGCYRGAPPTGAPPLAPAQHGEDAAAGDAAGAAAASFGIVHAGLGSITIGPLLPLLDAACAPHHPPSHPHHPADLAAPPTAAPVAPHLPKPAAAGAARRAAAGHDHPRVISHPGANQPAAGATIPSTAASAAAGAAADAPTARDSGHDSSGDDEDDDEDDDDDDDDDAQFLHQLAASLPGLRLRPALEPGALLRELRSKLAANCAINPLTALLGCANGALAEREPTRRLMRQVCGELVGVLGPGAFAPQAPPGAPLTPGGRAACGADRGGEGAGRGRGADAGEEQRQGAGAAAAAAAAERHAPACPARGGAGAALSGAPGAEAAALPDGAADTGRGRSDAAAAAAAAREGGLPLHASSRDPDVEQAAQALYEWVLGVAEATGRNRSSMLQDLEAGRRTEVDFLSGWVLRVARERGVAAPVNETLHALVKAREELMAEGKADGSA